MISKYATKPSENSRRANSINAGSTNHLRSYAPKRDIDITDEMARIGRYRRACETLDIARELGAELLEVWEE